MVVVLTPPLPEAVTVIVYSLVPGCVKRFCNCPEGAFAVVPSLNTYLYEIAFVAVATKLTTPEPSPFGLAVLTPSIFA